MKALYFQLLCGASGDMILSSMIDMGAPIEFLRKEFDRLEIEGLSIRAEKVRRSGISCSHLSIECGEQKAWRHLHGIIKLIEKGGYSPEVVANCRKILTRIAESEARVHGVEIEEVHFHEIGAIDTIVDVLGACLCMEHLDVKQVYFSALTVGHGAIETAHGIMPVPAPATADIISGLKIADADVPAEILTPTGAAVLVSMGSQRLALPPGRILSTGYGCGDREFGQRPNVLRVHLLDIADEPAGIGGDCVCVMESDMDHVSGEIMAFAAEEACAAGAVDVSWAPVFMKKGRPGYRMTVICKQEKAQKVADSIMAQTRTLGIRMRTSERITAQRRNETGNVSGGARGNIKHFSVANGFFSKPEYDSLAAMAREKNIPLIDLMDTYGRREDG